MYMYIYYIIYYYIIYIYMYMLYRKISNNNFLKKTLYKKPVIFYSKTFLSLCINKKCKRYI